MQQVQLASAEGRQVLHRSPEAEKSPTGLENLLCAASAKDSTSQWPQQLQAGSVGE